MTASRQSVCPFCGVGCQVSLKVKDGASNMSRAQRAGQREPALRQGPLRLRLHPPPAPADQAADPPRGRAAKGLNVDPANPGRFREATWEEALDSGRQGGMKRLRGGRHGAAAVAGFGSAKCTNEEAYLFQKLIRQGFGHNNVDHCTRLCHASSVAALMENVGSGAVTATFNEIENADVPS
jgi:formate dehydrogenase major subunit